MMRALHLASVLASIGLALSGCGGTVSLPDPLNLSGTATATSSAKWTFTGNPVADAAQFNPVIAKVKTFAANDIDNAIADANAQVPPDSAGAGCWTTVKAALPVLNFPADTGGATLIQKARDAIRWGPVILQQCSNVIPLVGLP